MYRKQLLNQFLNQVVLIAIFSNWKSLVWLGLVIRLRAKSLASYIALLGTNQLSNAKQILSTNQLKICFVRDVWHS